MSADQNIAIQLLAHQELPLFQQFVKEYWNENHIFIKEKSVFDWQHKGPSAYHYMVARQGNSLVGVQGLIPQSQFDSELPANQIFLALWKVLETKGIGLGLRLYQNIIEKYSPVFIGSLGIAPRAIPFHEWQGFTVGSMDHYVVLSPYIKEFRIAEVPKNLNTNTSKKRSEITFQKINEKDLLKLDTKTLYEHQWPCKSDTYMVNRFMKHPAYTYNVYALFKNNTLKAITVIRPISLDGSLALRFVDFIGSNESFSLVHDFIIELLETTGAEYIDIYSHGITSVILQEAGFISRKKIKGLIVPNYFEPFERKNVDILFGYKTSNPHIHIRLFKADGDQDRPSQM